MLIATTEGLTLSTTLTKSGNTWALLSIGGGVQSGSIRLAVGVAGGVDGGVDGGVCSSGKGGKEQVKEQLVPNRRDKISIRDTTRYFIFTLFIANSIIAGGKAKTIAWGRIIVIFFQNYPKIHINT